MNRKLVKGIFMPLIYGKTPISISEDIHEYFEEILSRKESHTLSTLFIEYWNKKYEKTVTLMRLVKNIG